MVYILKFKSQRSLGVFWYLRNASARFTWAWLVQNQ